MLQAGRQYECASHIGQKPLQGLTRPLGHCKDGGQVENCMPKPWMQSLHSGPSACPKFKAPTLDAKFAFRAFCVPKIQCPNLGCKVCILSLLPPQTLDAKFAFWVVAPHFSDEPLFTRFIGGEPPPSSLPPIASSPCARVRVWPGVALFTFVWQRYKG